GASWQLRPSPITTKDPETPPTASQRIPPSFEPSTQRSFGHLIRTSSPSKLWERYLATPIAVARGIQVQTDRFSRRAIQEIKRLPSVERHCRPNLPRPCS